MTRFLLILLFFTLPFIHGKFFPTIGIDWFLSVSGNFEFSKSIFFNIFSGIIFGSYFIESIVLKKEKQRSYDNKILITLGVLLLGLITSTLFSLSPFTSLIGDDNKGHTTLLFFNLLGIFYILQSFERVFLKKLIFTSLLSALFICLISIKELFFQTYDYGALSTRALGSFGHPNYLAGYLLILFPFISILTNNFIKLFVSLMFLITLFFTKSIVALFLIVGYFLYHFGKKHTFNKSIYCFIIGGSIFISLCILIKFFPEKLHSFLSRFYLWETTLKIIFSDWKIFFFGAGSETLSYFFNSFKSPELYIYENYGYSADRPHNFFLHIFYHFGVFIAGLFLYFVYRFVTSLKKIITPEKISLVLFLLFGVFHYFSIASYLIIVLCIVLSFSTPLSTLSCEERGNQKNTKKLVPSPYRRGLGRGVLLILTLISLFGAYYSFQFYQSETLFNQQKYTQAQDNFSHPKYLIKLENYKQAERLEGITSKRNIQDQIITEKNKDELCITLTSKYPSVENYFYCGNVFEKLGEQELSQNYYKKGLEKLPDLWNKDSLYWDNYFIKNTITGNRFFSEKFGDIESILDKIGK